MSSRWCIGHYSSGKIFIRIGKGPGVRPAPQPLISTGTSTLSSIRTGSRLSFAGLGNTSYEPTWEHRSKHTTVQDYRFKALWFANGVTTDVRPTCRWIHDSMELHERLRIEYGAEVPPELFTNSARRLWSPQLSSSRLYRVTSCPFPF